MWEPASTASIEALIAEQLTECSPQQRELFARLRVPLRAVPIDRNGHVESVFVVAQSGHCVMYYEDVEEGFSLSSLSPSGSIASPGFEQWRLSHALANFAP